MRMRKLLCVLLAGTSVFAFSACGTQMTELSDDQMEAIAMYSADVVSKYNGGQKKGYSFYIPSAEEDSDADNTNSSENGNTSDGGNTADPNANGENGTTTDPNANGENGTTDPGTANGGNVITNTVDSTLTDLIGQSGITFAITASEVVDHYTVEGVMDLSPGSGKEYFLLHVTAVNSGASDAALDIPSKGFTYTCTVGDSTVSSSGSGFVSNEFSSWSGTIPAGGTQELLLFFPFKKEALTDTSVFQLNAAKAGTRYRITQ